MTTNQTSAAGEGKIISDPQLNEIICLRLSGGWAVCGPRFFSMDGNTVRTVEHFANGDVRYCNRRISDVRILRNGQLCAIGEIQVCPGADRTQAFINGFSEIGYGETAEGAIGNLLSKL